MKTPVPSSHHQLSGPVSATLKQYVCCLEAEGELQFPDSLFKMTMSISLFSIPLSLPISITLNGCLKKTQWLKPL